MPPLKVEAIKPEAVTELDDENQILDRIDKPESKLAADQQRKAKFQKPEMQQQWQAELADLWHRLKAS